MQSQWTAESAGGCANFPSWRTNPQFLVRSKRAKVFVLLSIPKEQVQQADFRSIGFYVLKLEDDSRVATLEPESLLKKAPFRKSHEGTPLQRFDRFDCRSQADRVLVGV